ncbi:MAG: hypothetical protein ABSF98_00960 [Bryobacteraceae bacterium]|jgi:hypothetical protein
MAILNRAQAAEQAGAIPRQALVDRVEALAADGFHSQVLMLSFLFAVTRSRAYARQLLNTVVRTGLDPPLARFFYWQFDSIAFRFPETFGDAEQIMLAEFYRRLVGQWRGRLRMDLHWMPPAERCGGHVVVAAVQMLNVAHAPTHQTLETCRTLQRDLGKRVLLVNTAEMPRAMPLPYYGALGANFAEPLTGLAEVAYKGEVFAFRQFAGGMKTDEELTDCLRTVAAWKPEFVFTIGGPSVAADLCAGFTTVVTLPMAAGFPVSAGTLFVALGVPDEKQRRLQQALQVPDERVTFHAQGTFDLPPRSATLQRAALEIPDDAFVLVVAGNRLDDDVTGEFATAVAGLLETAPRAFAVLVGPFAGQASLSRRTRAIGFQTDLLAVYEIGDAFLNPPRLGGGSSAAFALAMGLPVLTLAEGDVAAVAGEAFVFPSFAAIEAEVRRLMADTTYRESRRAQARSRWNEISDRQRMMAALLGWIEPRLPLRA